MLSYHGGKMLVGLHILFYCKVTNSDLGSTTDISQNLGDHHTIGYIPVAYAKKTLLKKLFISKVVFKNKQGVIKNLKQNSYWVMLKIIFSLKNWQFIGKNYRDQEICRSWGRIEVFCKNKFDFSAFVSKSITHS